MNEIMIDLQGGAKAPLYEKIYEYTYTPKANVSEGRTAKGEKLPSTRLLAKNLSVSRSTVELAYDQLLAEGYIEAEPYRGYFVCDIEALYQLEQRNHMQEKLQEMAKKGRRNSSADSRAAALKSRTIRM